MFKRRSLTLCAVICALVAIIGAGFSAWVFSAERRGDVNLGISIDYATAFGEIKTPPTTLYRIQLDQGGTSDADKADVNKGITLEYSTTGSSWDPTTAIEATWVISEQSYKDASSNASKPIEYSVNIYIKTDTLGQYVEIPTASGFVGNTAITGAGDHAHSGYTAYTKTLTSSDITVGSPSNNYYNVKMNFAIPSNLFAYKSGKKPQTFQQYQDMVKTVLGIESVDHGTVYGTTLNDGKHMNGETEYDGIIIEFRVVNNNLN